MQELKIKSAVSNWLQVDERDSEAFAAALNALGYWQPDPEIGIVPFDPDYRFFEAVKKFQRDHGLFGSGAFYPGDETEKEINAALKRLKDSGQSYIWRTVGDSKVRGAHAARNGKLFRWNEDLPGGHPGEDFNCRCWAEPYLVEYQPPADIEPWSWEKHHTAKAAAQTVPQEKAPPIPPRKPDVPEEQLYPDAIEPVYPVETAMGVLISALKGAKLASAAKETLRQIELKRLEALRRLNSPKPQERRRINADRSQLQSKYKHSENLGVKGNPNNKTLKEFEKKLEDFINAEDTIEIKGTYHKTEEVIHYYDPKTKLNVMTDRMGNYRTGPWELGEEQIEHLLKSRNLGGN